MKKREIHKERAYMSKQRYDSLVGIYTGSLIIGYWDRTPLRAEFSPFIS
jgi:hypothetical protein